MKEKNKFVQWITDDKVNRRLCMFTFMFVPLLLLVVFYRTKEFQYFRRLGKTILGKVKRHDR